MMSGAPRRLSDPWLLVACWAGGLILGVGSVFALSGGDSYERVDSLIGMSVLGTLVSIGVGVRAIVVRAGLRRFDT